MNEILFNEMQRKQSYLFDSKLYSTSPKTGGSLPPLIEVDSLLMWWWSWEKLMEIELSWRWNWKFSGGGVEVKGKISNFRYSSADYTRKNSNIWNTKKNYKVLFRITPTENRSQKRPTFKFIWVDVNICLLNAKLI